MKRIRKAVRISRGVIREEGVVSFVKKTAKFIYYKKNPEKKPQVLKDILFINGCSLQHPKRYRVDHQVEQLFSQGLSVDEIYYDRLSLDKLKNYRGFIFYRCPSTEIVKEFIGRAKFFNKTCFFDIDDLVIDVRYTDSIEYVSKMSNDDKAEYDDGVKRMKETMELCDYAIVSTSQLKTEIDNNFNIKEVFINRNTMSDEMVYLSNKALNEYIRDDDRIIIGYFSGSITHNENFNIVLEDIKRIISEYENVYLKIMGILDVPEELSDLKDKIITIPFKDWKELPREMVDCDIHIAPLKDTIFNRAKSENKWAESALVKRPIVASDIGSFKESVHDGITGVLVADNQWYEALKDLIEDKDKRLRIGNNAHRNVIENRTTIKTGAGLSQFIKSKLARNIGFVLPSTDISGGVNVVLRHADILRRSGWDVTVLDNVSNIALKNTKNYNYRYSIPRYNIVRWNNCRPQIFFDTMVATLWATLDVVKKYNNVKNKLYFVQGMETDFFSPGSGEGRLKSNATYCDETGVKYITMSPWCQEWLKKRFNKESKYASNGIDLELYPFRKRDFKGKIKILIEGDSRSEYKNTDEAFRVVDKLDSDKFEIHYLSYRKEPKDWYRVDKFYNRIPPEEVGKVYAECDILLKTSILESFSYPPLEMMATGGVSVVVPNGGNAEYLIDRKNCLLYEQGNIDGAVSCIEEILSNDKLRNELIENGIKTANSYKWSKKEADILKLYE